MLVPFAAELGHNVTDLALSVNSIRKQRVAHRSEMAAELKQSFSLPLTVFSLQSLSHFIGMVR